MIRTFEELYAAELAEARSAEEMLVRALPGMAKAADNPELKLAFEEHLAETRTHLARMDELVQRHPRGEKESDGSMSAMVAEAEKMIARLPFGALRDAELIASAQRIEHYEIAVYGTLATYAKGLGLPEDKKVLGAILEEEKAADEGLTDIATGIVNPQAMSAAAA
jgi:ferritin-like metal-binding protein YciE